MSMVRTADGSHTQMSERYGETFHSTHGAITEARHVYLDASGVRQRLEARHATRVLEIGFGLGLNTLLTADLAKTHGAALDYHAIEHDRSVCESIGRLEYEHLLQHPSLLAALLPCLEKARDPDSLSEASGATDDQTAFSKPTPQRDLPASSASTPSQIAGGSNRPMDSITLDTDIQLTLHWCNAIDIALPRHSFHAIYLDAFSPDTNPECWTADFMHTLHSLLIPGTGRLSTYCAKGAVRRALIGAGFTVTKLPGPPGKREIMVAAS